MKEAKAMNPKFSVIIPVYNAQATIRKCLESLLCQNWDDIEIIVINDGSIDETAEICNNYAEKDCRVRFISKPNGGVSSARNAGLDAARGEYITFVDSDDYVASNYFDVLSKALEVKYDFLLFGARPISSNIPDTLSHHSREAKTPETAAEILSCALREQNLNSPINKVFCRSIIDADRIRFAEQLSIGEDKVFVVQYALRAKSAKMISELLYIVNIDNPDSLSRRARVDLCDSILLEHKLLFDALQKAELDSDSLALYSNAISYSYYRSAYTVAAELRKLHLTEKERFLQTRTICRRYAERNNCTFYDLNHRLMALPIRRKLAGIVYLILRMKSISK